MKVSGQGYQEFFAELKRRKVFRVMAVYGATAFVVLQVADLLAQGMGLSDQVLRITTFLVLIGFPIAIVLAWAFETTPEGVRRTEDAAPEEIDAIIAAPASERIPAGLMALVGVAALVLGAYWVGTRSAGEPTAVETGTDARLAFADPGNDSRPSIAVLPFVDMSPEGDQEYFSDGITEEILNTLAGIRKLKVAARTSAFAFKGQQMDMRAVGDSLGVAYLIEGSVRKAGDQLRITAQLIDATDGSHIWSNRYDEELTAANVFAIQTEIAEAIAEALRIPLGLEEGERLVSPTEDLEAYDLYLAGRARLRKRDISEAIDLFEAAIARDSTWAPPWAGLAETRALIPYYPGEGTAISRDASLWARSLASAEQAADRALELDPDNASAWVALANVQRDRFAWDAADDSYRHALSLDPDNAEAHQQYAEYLWTVGRMDESYRSAKRTAELDPTPVKLGALARAALFNERYAEARQIRIEEGWQSLVISIPLLQGDLEAFREELLRYLEGTEQYVELAGQIAQAWPAGSQPSPEAIELIEEVRIVLSTSLIHMAMGQHEFVIQEWVRYAPSLEGVPTFGSEFLPAFDPIRDDPRIQAILAKKGLEGRVPRRLGPDEGP